MTKFVLDVCCVLAFFGWNAVMDMVSPADVGGPAMWDKHG